MPEYWTHGTSYPTRIAEVARKLESDGWDGVIFSDTQNLRMDVYITLALVIASTTRLKVSAGVTNPVTRHPAVAASAHAGLQAASGGRASFGIGRGDSALAYIGMAPCSMDVFERYVRAVATYLRGGRVPFDELPMSGKSVSTLHLGDEPAESWLRWLDPSVPKVPVEVVASGPKALAVGARHADIVTFTVGADLERLKWGMDTVKEASRAAGRDESELKFGAFLNVACHSDIRTARMLVSGGLASFSRFAAMHGTPTGPLTADTEEVVRSIRDRYDMKHHGEPGSAQTSVMTDEFIDRFGVVGDADAVARRVQEIADLGFERIYLETPSQPTRDRHPSECAAADKRMAGEVLPKLKAGGGGT
jgi:5,10-methylenetetrahydromethanopterin reductase